MKKIVCLLALILLAGCVQGKNTDAIDNPPPTNWTGNGEYEIVNATKEMNATGIFAVNPNFTGRYNCSKGLYREGNFTCRGCLCIGDEIFEMYEYWRDNR